MKKNILALTLQDAVGPQYHIRRTPVRWDVRKTGAIICDMWDLHWCESATRRVVELTPRLSQTVCFLRDIGIQIVHAPSDTMDFYSDSQERRDTLEATKGIELLPSSKGEAKLAAEPPLLVDREGIECDCAPVKCKQRHAWRRQIEDIAILPGDFIGDGLEVLRALRSRGIEQVFMLGVHTNMCVLGRPFAIRNMIRYGFSPVLVRDLTDCRATNEEPPFCNHFTALDYVIRHIEKYLCPTVTSGELIGDGHQFRSCEDTRPVRPSGEELDRQMAEWVSKEGQDQ